MNSIYGVIVELPRKRVVKNYLVVAATEDDALVKACEWHEDELCSARMIPAIDMINATGCDVIDMSED